MAHPSLLSRVARQRRARDAQIVWLLQVDGATLRSIGEVLDIGLATVHRVKARTFGPVPPRRAG